MADQSVIARTLPGYQALLAAKTSAAWVRAYLWRAAIGDFACAVAAGVIAVQARFVDSQPVEYLTFTGVLPLLWVGAVALAGGYDSRFVGVGSDEFRRVLNAAVSLTAAVAIFSYVFKLNIARGYVGLAMPSTTLLDLSMRYSLRKHLHRMRSSGQCLRRVVVVGHAQAIAALAEMLSRQSYHGMCVVGACLAGPACRPPSGTSRCSATWTTSQPRWTTSARTWWPCFPARRWTAPGCASSAGRWRRPAPICAWPRP